MNIAKIVKGGLGAMAFGVPVAFGSALVYEKMTDAPEEFHGFSQLNSGKYEVADFHIRTGGDITDVYSLGEYTQTENLDGSILLEGDFKYKIEGIGDSDALTDVRPGYVTLKPTK